MSLTRIAGDPGAIASYARQMDDYSDELMDAARALRQVANTAMTISEAVDALRNDAFQAAEDTGKVVTRYVGAAAALATWAQRLEPIQRDGNAAADAWDAAWDDIGYWTRIRDERAADYAMAADGTPEQEEFHKKAIHAQDQLDLAWGRRRNAKEVYDQKIGEYNAAAKEAANGINAAQEMSQLNDGFWDEVGGLWQNVTNWVYEHAELLELIKQICEIVGNICSWIALGLTLIGCPAAAIFAGIALAAAIVSLVISALLFFAGVGTLGDFVLSAVSCALAAVGAKVPESALKNVADGVLNAVESSNLVGPYSDLVWSPGEVFELIPGMDYTMGAPAGTLDGPMWTRPPDMEIPSLDGREFAPQDLGEAACASAQVSLELGDLKVQAFVEVCR